MLFIHHTRMTFCCRYTAGEMLLSGARHRLVNRQLSDYQHQMSLRISGVTVTDFRPYMCVAKNAVGEAADRVDLRG